MIGVEKRLRQFLWELLQPFLSSPDAGRTPLRTGLPFRG